jgi:hypothetical protein
MTADGSAPFGMPKSVVDPKAGRGPSRRPAAPRTHPRKGVEEDAAGLLLAQEGLSLDGIVGMPVLAQGTRVGTVVDVVVNDSLTTVLGVDLTTASDRRTRFLPWFLLRTGAGHLALLNDAELSQTSTIARILGRGRRLSSRPLSRGGVVTPLGDIRLR